MSCRWCVCSLWSCMVACQHSTLAHAQTTLASSFDGMPCVRRGIGGWKPRLGSQEELQATTVSTLCRRLCAVLASNALTCTGARTDALCCDEAIAGPGVHACVNVTNQCGSDADGSFWRELLDLWHAGVGIGQSWAPIVVLCFASWFICARYCCVDGCVGLLFVAFLAGCCRPHFCMWLWQG